VKRAVIENWRTTLGSGLPDHCRALTIVDRGSWATVVLATLDRIEYRCIDDDDA
jgi:hypothetical protein